MLSGATDPVKARRRRGMATPPTTPIIPSEASSQCRTEITVFPAQDNAVGPRRLDYLTKTTAGPGGYLEVAAANVPATPDKSPPMRNSVSEISLTGFQFPMPPTHAPSGTAPSASETSLNKDLPPVPAEDEGFNTAPSRLSGPFQLPHGSRSSLSSGTDSARSSVSNASNPWRRRREPSVGSMYASLSQLGFPAAPNRAPATAPACAGRRGAEQPTRSRRHELPPRCRSTSRPTGRT